MTKFFWGPGKQFPCCDKPCEDPQQYLSMLFGVYAGIILLDNNFWDSRIVKTPNKWTSWTKINHLNKNLTLRPENEKLT